MQAHHRVIVDPAPIEDRIAQTHRPARVLPFRSGRGLDDREVHAIAVGRADAFRYGWSAVQPRTRLARWIAALTGVRGATPFADEKLEALRLFACVMRRDDRGLDTHAAMLIAHGYGQAALHQAIGLALA